MRKRSCTIYAESMEEYTVLATQPQNTTFRPSPVKPNVPKRDYLADSSPQNNDFWDDFDFQSRKNQQNDSVEFIDQQRVSDAETDCTEASPKKSRNVAIKRFMVLGSAEANTFELIDSTFKSDDDMSLSPLNQTMDLIIKKEQTEGLQCQFWLKSLEDKRYSSLVKVYYKSASTFVFVYSTASRKSLEMAEQAIQEVMKEVPKFSGILLANTGECDDDDREVSYDDGAQLQMKYNLMFFTETNKEDMSLKEKILNPYGLLF